MSNSVACFLGAGFSYVAGVPLARNLFDPSWLIIASESSRKRFETVLEHCEGWRENHPDEYSEQYMGAVYDEFTLILAVMS